MDTDSSFNQDINYENKQLVSATYLDLKTSIKGFSVRGGLRSEHARFTFTPENVDSRQYFNFIPSVSVSGKTGERLFKF